MSKAKKSEGEIFAKTLETIVAKIGAIETRVAAIESAKRGSTPRVYRNMLVFIAASAAIVPAVYAELFPTSIRTVGVGVPYSICVAVFGGTAPYLQQWLGTTMGVPQLFNIYAVVLLAVSAAFVFTIPETMGKDLTH